MVGPACAPAARPGSSATGATISSTGAIPARLRTAARRAGVVARRLFSPGPQTAVGRGMRRLLQALGQPDRLVLASLLVVLGICGLVGSLLLEARRDAWDRAAQEADNMRRLVARDLARNLEVFDLSLRAIQEHLAIPGVTDLPVQIRDMVLFDRAITASHVGAVFATDAAGNMLYRPMGMRRFNSANFADRDYFQAHRANPDLGLYISRPERGRATGIWRITLSRRRNNPDGSFGGVVAAGIQLSYFRELFNGLELGPGGLIALNRTDGVVLFRSPWRPDALGADVSASETFQRSLPNRPEAFVARSAIDNIPRLFASGPIDVHPLRVMVGLSTAEIDAPWRRKAILEVLITLLLSAGVLGLALAWRRTLRDRVAAEARFRILAENSGDMVTRLGLDLTRLYASPAAQRVMGRPPAEIIGRPSLDHIHPDDRAAVAATMATLTSGATEETSLVYRVLRPDLAPGEEAWVEGTVRLTRNPDSGAPDGFVVVTRDVTERLRLERERAAREVELAQARDAAEAGSRAKSRFLSSMSHELRTPLNVILGFAQVLSLDRGLRETQRDQLAAMQSAGRHLLDMISGILDFSRIEAGQLDLSPSVTPLRPLVSECLEMVGPAAAAKGLQLALEVEPDAPLAARVDPVRLRQVLLNLLGNAVKFTAQGGISLRLLAAGTEGLRLEVVDTGRGIASADRGRLFRDFERLSDADATVQGSGLGLAISARLVALMGGRLGYAENPGGGSLFWLELPLQPA